MSKQHRKVLKESKRITFYFSHPWNVVEPRDFPIFFPRVAVQYEGYSPVSDEELITDMIYFFRNAQLPSHVHWSSRFEVSLCLMWDPTENPTIFEVANSSVNRLQNLLLTRQLAIGTPAIQKLPANFEIVIEPRAIPLPEQRIFPAFMTVIQRFHLKVTQK
jgi:hypothetical protein